MEHALLEVAGELDFTHAEMVVAAAGALPHRIVAFDLRELEFLDIAGARALGRLSREIAERTGAAPRVTGAAPAVERAFELAGLAKMPLLV